MLALFTFFQTNIKWIAILATVLLIAFFSWRYTVMVREVATARYQIEQLQQNIKDKDKTIQFERDLNKLADDAMLEQQKKIDELKNTDVLLNLPEDNSNLAPESIRETIRRLGGK